MKKSKKWLVAFTMLLTLTLGIGTLTSCDKNTTWIESNSTERTQMSMSIPSANAQGIEPLADTIDLGTFASKNAIVYVDAGGDTYDFEARRIYVANDELIADKFSNAILLNDVQFNFDMEYYENNVDSDYISEINRMDTAFYFLEDYSLEENFDYDIYFAVSEYVLSIDEILDKQAPTVGGSVNVLINIDNQPSQEEILSHVTAWDDTDGVVPVVVESSTYVQGEMKVGVFYINISATDKAGNKATGVITCYKNDYTAPVISGQTTYDLNYDHDLTLDKIKESLNITDNVDNNLELELVSDNFTNNSHKLGNYQVVFKTKDLSNNESENFTINIAVKNKGTAVITAVSKITIPTSQLLTLEELKSKISVVDGYDGVIEDYDIAGFEDYTATSKEVGTNVITISYTNSGGNTATAYIELVKEDNIPPVILYDSYFILLKQGETLTMDQLKEQAAKVLKLNVEDIIDVQGDWNTEEVGSYQVMVSLRDGTNEGFMVRVGSVNKSEETYTWTPEQFFSGNMDNWTTFEAWPSWSICAWLSWFAIGIASLVVSFVTLAVAFKGMKRLFSKLLR